MSNIVRTWEEEAISAGEIELTDAQLADVFGAWGEEEECEPKHKPECEEEKPICHNEEHECKIIKKKVSFCFEKEFSCKKDDDDCESKNDWH